MNKLLLFFLLTSQALISFSQNFVCTSETSECGKLLWKGYLTEYDKKYKEAVDIYKEAILKDSTCCDAYNFLGAAYSKNGEFDEAIKVYIKSLSVNPNNLVAYSRLGQLYLHIGLTKESIDFYQKGLTVKPDNLNLLLGLSNAFLKDNNTKDALSTITKALKIVEKSSVQDDNYVSVNRDAGIIYYISGVKEPSIGYMIKAYEFMKKDPELNYYIGKYYDDNNNKEAKSYFKKAYKLGYKIDDSILTKYEIK